MDNKRHLITEVVDRPQRGDHRFAQGRRGGNQAHPLRERQTPVLFRQFAFQDAQGMKEVTSEDGRDRKFSNVLNDFYDEVVAAVRGAETIQIFGPGEAKGELEKRLERAGLKAHVLAIEPADKMTEPEIAAKVRKHFGREGGPAS